MENNSINTLPIASCSLSVGITIVTKVFSSDGFSIVKLQCSWLSLSDSSGKELPIAVICLTLSQSCFLSLMRLELLLAASGRFSSIIMEISFI
jgi:hypothetical protein